MALTPVLTTETRHLLQARLSIRHVYTCNQNRFPRPLSGVLNRQPARPDPHTQKRDVTDRPSPGLPHVTSTAPDRSCRRTWIINIQVRRQDWTIFTDVLPCAVI